MIIVGKWDGGWVGGSLLVVHAGNAGGVGGENYY